MVIHPSDEWMRLWRRYRENVGLRRPTRHFQVPRVTSIKKSISKNKTDKSLRVDICLSRDKRNQGKDKGTVHRCTGTGRR